MIDHEMTAMFPPIFIPESVPGLVFFPWLDEPDFSATPAVLLVVQGAGCIIGETPTRDGSRVVVTDRGVELHLSVADARVFKDRQTIIALWLAGLVDGEPDKAGALVVSDWAFAPAEGFA